MAASFKKASRFWRELKRRNVIRVLTVYAGAAFVILELVDMIREPFEIPNWAFKLVVILIIVGFIITMLFSWIYDVNSGGAMVKTGIAERNIPEEKPQPSVRWKIATYISFIVILGLLTMNVIQHQSAKGGVTDRSIAILPFENLSEEDGNQFFVDGLVDDLLNRISIIEELKVISRTSSEMYRERGRKRIPQIASELNVAFILEGSVQRYGDKVRIAVQLIDARDDDQVWAESYDRNLSDVFQTQREIALQIASELDAILNKAQTALLEEDKTANIKAFELYQLGRFYWNKRTPEGYAKSIEFFKEANRTDPDYGLAYAGLADTYALMSIQGYMDTQEGASLAKEFAFKALGIDRNLPEAYTVLAEIYDYVEWEWEKAESAYQRALALNPNYSTAYHYYSEHLSITGRHKQAREQINKAIELDPLSFVIRFVSAKLYFHQGSAEEALRELRICEEIQPGHLWTLDLRFKCYWQLGLEDDAFRELRSLISVATDYDLTTADQIFKEQKLKGVLQWLVDLNISQENPPYLITATLLAMLGQDQEALAWLENAFRHGQISPEISFDLYFRQFHNQKIFLDIMKEMQLTEYLDQ